MLVMVFTDICIYKKKGFSLTMDTQKMIYLRADGNPQIASGHLMRCLTIARALRKKEVLPVFIVSDPTSIEMLRNMFTPEEISSHAFPIVHLQTAYDDLEAEIPVLSRILTAQKPQCMLVDSYFATAAYFEALQGLCPLAYLDDLQSFDAPVDLVINYDLSPDTSFYQNARRILTGAAYTPLREQFSLQQYHVWEQVKDVLISTGATDPWYIAADLLESLLADPFWKDTCFHMMTGPVHQSRERLLSYAASDSRVQIHENVKNMASLMAECDLALSAGGTTLYELCAIGVPTVSFAFTDNHLPGIRDFAAADLIPTAGDIRTNKDFIFHTAETLKLLALTPAQRTDQSFRMRMAIDGAGANRIAGALLKL